MNNKRTAESLAALLIAVCAAGCTTVGVNTRERTTIDYGPPMTLKVCVLRAPGVTAERVDELVAAVNKEFAVYNIQVVVPWQQPWQRAGFTSTSLFDDVAGRDLEMTGSSVRAPISSGKPKIDEAAIKLAKGASGLFPPGLVDGQPAGTCLRDAMTFRLASAGSW